MIIAPAPSTEIGLGSADYLNTATRDVTLVDPILSRPCDECVCVCVSVCVCVCVCATVCACSLFIFEG